MSVRYSDIRDLEKQLIEAREQIAAYQVRVDNDALRMDPARVEIAADLLRDMAKARSREANLAHPLTADRFSASCVGYWTSE